MYGQVTFASLALAGVAVMLAGFVNRTGGSGFAPVSAAGMSVTLGATTGSAALSALVPIYFLIKTPRLYVATLPPWRLLAALLPGVAIGTVGFAALGPSARSILVGLALLPIASFPGTTSRLLKRVSVPSALVVLSSGAIGLVGFSGTFLHLAIASTGRFPEPRVVAAQAYISASVLRVVILLLSGMQLREDILLGVALGPLALLGDVAGRAMTPFVSTTVIGVAMRVAVSLVAALLVVIGLNW
jgi:hypothetical protein